MKTLTVRGIPVITLVMNVIIPIVGILFLGWGALEVIYMYFFETVVIGAFYIPRILVAKGEKIFLFGKDYSEQVKEKIQEQRELQSIDAPVKLKAFLAVFFLMHYGIFIAIQGSFIFGMLSEGIGGMSKHPNLSFFGEMFYPPIAALYEKNLGLSVLLLVIVQAFDFVTGFLASGEYRVKHCVAYMIEPYKRVFVQQFTVILGAFVMILTNAPAGAAILLIVFKTGIDLWLQAGKLDLMKEQN